MNLCVICGAVIHPCYETTNRCEDCYADYAEEHHLPGARSRLRKSRTEPARAFDRHLLNRWLDRKKLKTYLLIDRPRHRRTCLAVCRADYHELAAHATPRSIDESLHRPMLGALRPRLTGGTSNVGVWKSLNRFG